MKTISFLALSLFLLSQNVFANNMDNEGEKLYKTYCSACHGATGGMDMNKRLAPPIAAVRLHYIAVMPDKTSFVKAIANWVEKQDVNKTLMRGAIRKFKLMPPVAVSRKDAEKIAAYIYEGKIDEPAGFREHVEQMHGNKAGM